MMNGFALCLLLTSVVTAGVFSPYPQHKQDVVVNKAGLKVVMVEYEQEDGTRVPLSSKDQINGKGYVEKISQAAKGAVNDAKEKLKEASTIIPNLGEGISYVEEENMVGHRPTPRELFCDAFGRCKHKIANAIGRTKEMVSENAEQVSDKVYGVGEDAKEAAGEAIDKVKGKANEIKETVAEKAREVGQGAREGAEKAKDMAGNVGDVSKTVVRDIERNTEKIEAAKGHVKEKTQQAKSAMHKAARIFREGWDSAYGIMAYVVCLESLDLLACVMHLLAVSCAYGMGLWVTFLSSYALARALPRQQFEIVQSKIYPVYFKAMAYGVGVALLGHMLIQRERLWKNEAEMFQGFILLDAHLMILANMLLLEPKATKLLLERIKLEKEEGIRRDGFVDEPRSMATADPVGDPTSSATTTAAAATPEKPEEQKIINLSEQLKKLNSFSSCLNILTLMALSWNLVYLAQRRQLAG